MTSKQKVAFIGLGAMGIGMALHLLEDGFAVAGFDLNSKALETLKSKGGIAAASPRESADGASVLVCVVGNADQCKSALLAESTGAAWGLPQDAVIVLCSTVPPEFPKQVQSWLDNDFNRPDIKVIDCPISGGTVRAAQGKLTIFCSGSKEALRQANAVLSSTSQYLYEMTGGLGWASKVKLVNQQLAGIHIAVAAEAMGLAAALGLDTLEVYDSVIGTPANSWMFQNRVPHMLADDWTPHSALQIFVKDMGIVTAEGRSWKFPLFLSSVSEQLYLLGARMGFGHEDDSGVVRTFSPQEPSAVALSKIKLKSPSTTGYEDILLIHELLETVHTAAAVEALALGIKMGLSASDVVPLIANAAGSSESFRTITEKILAGDFSTGKTIIEGCTKLEKIVARAREFRYPLHLTGTTLQLYQLALLQGHSSRNEAALLKLWPLPTQPRQQQTYESLPLAQTLAALPEFQHSTEGLRDTIQQKVQSRSDLVLVILDDDPTGTQTCHDINVLTMWDIDILSAEFSSGSKSFFILTNTRALPSAMARKLVREILTNVRQAALAIRKQFEVILRGDSTLRGHLLEEMESYIDILGPPDAWILAPFFQQGGRFTINDIHYVAENGLLIPAANTAFASDKTFGYHSSNLLEYVQEKAGSLFSPAGIVSISLEDIRERGETGVAKKVAAAPKGSVIVVNAVRDEDMLIFCSALFEVQKSHNHRFGYRVAASFVSSCLGLTRREPILPRNLPGFQASNHSGGLILAGSYVPKTTSQLQSLIQHRGDKLEVITVEVPTLIKESNENPLRALVPAADSTTVQKIIDEVSQLLAAGRDVLVMTSRQVVTAGSNYARTGSATDLDINNLVAHTLVHILRQIKIRPRYILSKGGVTSSDAATAGLGMKRARVLGQAAPGIPLWWCDKNSDFKSVDEGGREPILDTFGTNLLTRLPLIVFPGNVGGVDSLSELVEQWAV